jgi:hypothetical protein
MSNQAGLGIGDKVHNEEINEYPAEMMDEYLRLSDWVRQTYEVYGRHVWIKVIDPQSLVGLWKHIRFQVRHYPTFVVDGQATYAGWDSVSQALQQVEQLLSDRLAGTTADDNP